MKKLINTIILLCIGISSLAQNGIPPIAGARGFGIANAGVTFTDINAAFSNQAGLAYLKGIGVTVVGERRFSLAELNSISAAFAYPTKSGTFGLTINSFGYKVYNEQKIGFAYARKLMEKLAIGVQFDYLNTRISNYGSKATFTFEGGFHAELLPSLILAGHLFSPIRVSIVEEENLPTLFKLGLAYQVSKKVILLLEAVSEIDQNLTLKGGMEYTIFDSFFIRVGASSSPTLFSFGMGYVLKNGLAIDVASSYHQVLGFTPAVGVSFNFGKK